MQAVGPPAHHFTRASTGPSAASSSGLPSEHRFARALRPLRLEVLRPYIPTPWPSPPGGACLQFLTPSSRHMGHSIFKFFLSYFHAPPPLPPAPSLPPTTTCLRQTKLVEFLPRRLPQSSSRGLSSRPRSDSLLRDSEQRVEASNNERPSADLGREHTSTQSPSGSNCVRACTAKSQIKVLGRSYIPQKLSR